MGKDRSSAEGNTGTQEYDLVDKGCVDFSVLSGSFLVVYSLMDVLRTRFTNAS